MSSLRNAIRDRPNTVKFANLILQIRTDRVANKVVFIVEGDSDITLFNMVLRNENFFYCTPASGKGEVIEAVDQLKPLISNEIYGIVDADFDRILDNTYTDIFLTDKHDAEIMMLHSEFMTHFITEHTKTSSLVEINIDEAGDVLTSNLMGACNKIGLIKLACTMLGLNAKFKGINYWSKNCVSINGFNLEVNIETLINEVISRSPRVDPDSYSGIFAKYNELVNAEHCFYQTANGHDFCQLLSCIFKQSFSSDRNVTDKVVEKYLRSKYTNEHFKATNLYSQITTVTQGSTESSQVA
ncbi:DUF4435 domain-containing protein (plasmid) [Aliivibrio salmonicida]|uniref:DUF4435 domain-containing protein n=1 Tax=Aliivibrio salmonicida TaxID=40269 RepID=UPI000F70D393|nr:DUF4435 domain-containing protein [Aliivibrio salmonicida]AZL83338.1 DUF4435 domain-containing protein [Aliivibrio salmonicida]